MRGEKLWPNVRPSKPNFIGPPRSIYIEWLIGWYLLAIEFYNYMYCTIYVLIGTSTYKYINFQGNCLVSGIYLVMYAALLEQTIPLELLGCF